jgi:hypothetical protein
MRLSGKDRSSTCSVRVCAKARRQLFARGLADLIEV